MCDSDKNRSGRRALVDDKRVGARQPTPLLDHASGRGAGCSNLFLAWLVTHAIHDSRVGQTGVVRA